MMHSCVLFYTILTGVYAALSPVLFLRSRWLMLCLGHSMKRGLISVATLPFIQNCRRKHFLDFLLLKYMLQCFLRKGENLSPASWSYKTKRSKRPRFYFILCWKNIYYCYNTFCRSKNDIFASVERGTHFIFAWE